MEKKIINDINTIIDLENDGYELIDYLKFRKNDEIVELEIDRNSPKIIYPDYSNSSVNLISSIRKNFGYNYKYPSIKEVDDILNSKHVCLLVLDGLGVNILEKHLNENSFLKTHLVKKIVSTYPSTTTAATTSILTGLTPSETGWVGWHQYFEEYNDDIILFKGIGFYNGKKYDKNFAYDILPIKYFFSDMDIKGFIHGPSYFLNGSETLVELLDNAYYDMQEDNKTFSYCYWDNPDYILHTLGTDDIRVTNLLMEYDDIISDFYNRMPSDSTLIITSDHGHYNSKPIFWDKFKNLNKFFTKKPSIEARMTSFFVNDKKGFKDVFNKYFKDLFILMDKEEFLKGKYLGYGKLADRFIGDYVAIAIDCYYFDVENSNPFLSSHAGLTQDEMIIPICICKK